MSTRPTLPTSASSRRRSSWPGAPLSAAELVDACLARIRERDGTHSHDGDPGSINAWVRVYEDDARAAAARADARRSAAAVDRDGPAPLLCGIPIGLKDLYGVAGKPLTASSRLLDEVPAVDCDVWARLRADGDGPARPPAHARVRGRRDDRPGRQPLGARPLGRRLERRLGGGPRRPHDPRGDRHGHGRLAPHPVGALSGTSTIKPTRGLVSIAGIVPLSTSLDHAGPMARSLVDCAAAARGDGGAGSAACRRARSPAPAGPAARLARGTAPPLAGLRLALSPRLAGVAARSATSPTASPPCSRSAASWERRSSSRRRRLPRSTSETTSSTSSLPSSSSTTVASTAAATVPPRAAGVDRGGASGGRRRPRPISPRRRGGGRDGGVGSTGSRRSASTPCSSRRCPPSRRCAVTGTTTRAATGS